jgi:hypothetical protein
MAHRRCGSTSNILAERMTHRPTCRPPWRERSRSDHSRSRTRRQRGDMLGPSGASGKLVRPEMVQWMQKRVQVGSSRLLISQLKRTIVLAGVARSGDVRRPCHNGNNFGEHRQSRYNRKAKQFHRARLIAEATRMGWRDQAIELCKCCGAPAKLAAKMVLGAVLPGSPAVVDLKAVLVFPSPIVVYLEG